MLVDEGLRVDEDMVMKGYEAAVLVEGDEGESSGYLGGETGKKVLLMMSGP